LDISLIARYLAGECSGAGEQKVSRWIQSSPENRKLMMEFRRIWEAAGEENAQFDRMFDPEEDWDELRTRLMKEVNKKVTAASYQQAGSIQGLDVKARISQVIRVAAVIAIASLIGFVVYQQASWQTPRDTATVEPALREIAMDKGQRGNLTLSDGTKVQLNAESKIVLPNTFDSEIREVALEGEAYFDVAPNSSRPFVIRAGDAVVRVLGTAFGIRSYSEDNSVRVVVKEGRVSLQSQKTEARDKAVLTAGEMGELFLADNRISTEKVEDLDLFLSWTSGYLKFKNTPMAEVARQLERKYDIEVKFEEPELKELRLTAELRSRSIQYNLDAISTSLEVEYEMDQQQVVFYRKRDNTIKSEMNTGGQ